MYHQLKQELPTSSGDFHMTQTTKKATVQELVRLQRDLFQAGLPALSEDEIVRLLRGEMSLASYYT